MSHKFHGKGSGKKKTEKRVKKLQEEFVSRNLGSNLLPLHVIESSECWQWIEYSIASSGETEVK